MQKPIFLLLAVLMAVLPKAGSQKTAPPSADEFLYPAFMAGATPLFMETCLQAGDESGYQDVVSRFLGFTDQLDFQVNYPKNELSPSLILDNISGDLRIYLCTGFPGEVCEAYLLASRSSRLAADWLIEDFNFDPDKMLSQLDAMADFLENTTVLSLPLKKEGVRIIDFDLRPFIYEGSVARTKQFTPFKKWVIEDVEAFMN